MKRKYLNIAIVLLLLVWVSRYLFINNGHIFSYNDQKIHEYEMGEILNLSNNMSYYMYEQDGYCISVKSAKKISFDEFCNESNKTINDFLYHYDEYIEVTVLLQNTSKYENEYQLLGLVLRGVDWFSLYDSSATTYVNHAESVEGDVSSITLPPEKSCEIKIMYGINRGTFPLSRWNQFENEKIWLIATIQPIENRIRIYV